MARIADISVGMTFGVSIRPGGSRFQLKPVGSISPGQVLNTARLDMDVLTGTHFAVPRHFTQSETTAEAPGKDLDLLSVRPGSYEFCCLPVKRIGADGAAARAMLREIVT